jgi:acetyl-CoA carboxylase biotin carboxyl carrier protein
MTEKAQPESDQFDLDRLKQLIRLMEKHDLSEVRLQKGDQRWVLRRGSTAVPHAPSVGTPAPGFAPLGTAAGAVPAGAGMSGAPPTAAPPPEERLLEIRSPTVGTFYAAAQPGDPPFVKVGDRVRPETTVCIVEAMKVFNQIPAEVSGFITKVLASDGDVVEFGQPLFLVKPE